MDASKFEQFVDSATNYVVQRVSYVARQQLNDDVVRQVESMVRAGLSVASNSGEKHWELAFRGALEVVIQKIIYPAEPTYPSLDLYTRGHMKESSLSVDRFNPGPLPAALGICPLWPVC